MPANPRLEHVRFVKGRVAGEVRWYAYFDTGKRKPDGRSVYVSMINTPFGTTGFYDSYASMLGARTKRETAAYTGQSYKVVEYYAKRINQRRMASAAILKLEDSRRKRT